MIQPSRFFFSEEEKQESKRIEYLAPEGVTINNPYTEGPKFRKTMVIVKCSDTTEGVKLDGLLCGELYKGDNGSIVTW